MPPRITPFREMFRKLVKREADEWLERNTGWIGDADGVVDVGDGMINVTLNNGNVVQVLNRFAPGRATTPVQIGRSRYLPTIWQVISFRNSFDAPPGEGAIKYHFHQHMYGAEDMVPIHRKQITQLTVFPSPVDGAFYVVLYGDIRLRSGSYIKISTQLRDLSSYVPSTGAVYVVIESNNTGVLSENVGDPIASPEVATPADIPVPASGKYPQAIILLYEGQAAIEYKDICVPWPTDFNPLDYSGPGHTHTIALDDLSDVTVPSPTDGQVLTYDFYSGEWIAMDPTGGAGFNDAEGDPEPVDDSAAADGTSAYSARRDHTHLLDMSAYILAQVLDATPQLEDVIFYRRDADGLIRKMELQDLINNLLISELSTVYAIVSHDHDGVGTPSVDHEDTLNNGSNTHSDIDDHIASTSNPHGVTAAQAVAIPQDGWIAGTGTWSYSSADAPSFVASIPDADAALMQPGYRIKLTQTSAKYFIVTAKGSPSGGFTPVTIYGGTDYTLANAAISSPYFSPVKGPFGFPLDPSKWTVITTDSSDRTQNTPTTNTWYNPGSLSISIPIGCWEVSYKALQRVQRASATLANMSSTLSTANNSESDADFTTFETVGGASGTQILLTTQHCMPKILTLAAKTSYFLNCRTTSGADSIGHRGDSGTTVIKAVCAYL